MTIKIKSQIGFCEELDITDKNLLKDKDVDTIKVQFLPDEIFIDFLLDNNKINDYQQHENKDTCVCFSKKENEIKIYQLYFSEE